MIKIINIINQTYRSYEIFINCCLPKDSALVELNSIIPFLLVNFPLPDLVEHHFFF